MRQLLFSYGMNVPECNIPLCRDARIALAAEHLHHVVEERITPYDYMMQVLGSERYAGISA